MALGEHNCILLYPRSTLQPKTPRLKRLRWGRSWRNTITRRELSFRGRPPLALGGTEWLYHPINNKVVRETAGMIFIRWTSFTGIGPVDQQLAWALDSAVDQKVLAMRSLTLEGRAIGKTGNHSVLRRQII